LASSALKLTNIDAFYGDSHVLQRVSFELGEGGFLASSAAMAPANRPA
jgi:ABC-type branched-subunit amino acid transport system ATPase component